MIVLGDPAPGQAMWPARLYGAHAFDGELVWVTQDIMAAACLHTAEEGAVVEVWEPATDTTIREDTTIIRVWRWNGTRNPAGEYRFALEPLT